MGCLAAALFLPKGINSSDNCSESQVREVIFIWEGKRNQEKMSRIS
uniref:Uncharacterized protein n=1 Tax=Anguilla anguilla TaxID=7936 RepID=A0A0E9VZ88_ANGAN